MPKMKKRFTKEYFCFHCETEFDFPHIEEELRPYGDCGAYETMYYCPNCGRSSFEQTKYLESPCYGCKYFMFCGDLDRTEPCNGREA